MLLMAMRAAAQTAPESAIELNHRSAELYRNGHYSEAAALLREAYRIQPEPILLWNLARACEMLSDYACAVAAYESYLPNAGPGDRISVEQRLATCRAALAAAAAVLPAPSPAVPPPAAPPPAAPPPAAPDPAAEPRHDPDDEPAISVSPPPALRAPPAPRRRLRTILPLAVGGIGTAGIGIGVALASVARSRHDEAVLDPSQRSASRKQELAESMMHRANVALVAGGTLATAGLVWWLLDARSERAATRSPGASRLRLHIGLGSVALGGAF
jgi:tetratricopeptide (TPR) repeat protein